MQTILVTGGAGFIGGWLVRRLIADGMRVVNLDLLTYAGNLDSLAEVEGNPRHIFVQGDITDFELVHSLLDEHRPCAVFHLAAETHVDRSIDGPSAFVRTNVLGTHQLLAASIVYWRQLSRDLAEQFRFVHISTDEVYGSLGPQGAFRESDPYDPHSPYSASKASSDHFVRAYFDTYGLPTIVTNCSNNFGPYQFPEKLIPLMILNSVEGKPLPVYGDGGNVRDWLYVEDHVQALCLARERGRPGQTYNIGGGSERTNLQVVQAICEIVDGLLPALPQGSRRRLVQHVPDRPGHDRRYAVDAGKIERELGWIPRQSFETALQRTVEWYLENTTWVQRVSRGVYCRERLGLALQGATP